MGTFAHLLSVVGMYLNTTSLNVHHARLDMYAHVHVTASGQNSVPRFIIPIDLHVFQTSQN